MKRKIVNPDPTHKKRIEKEEKAFEKDIKNVLENEEELNRELKYKTPPHNS